MFNFLPWPFLYFISSLLLFINTFIWAGLISIGGIIKFLIPILPIRTAISKLMHRFMWCWASCNGGILFLIADIEWDIKGLEDLNPENWYLVISNHRSGFDIAVQTYILRNHIPMLKFFLKKELLYIPLFGTGCWALDMPFMTRTSAEKLRKNPKLKGKDLEATRKACNKFKHTPTAIINYVEGSRFTPQKRKRQNSPYQYLLRPKAGGIAFTLAAMGEQFTNLLNMTLVYPDAKSNPLKEAMQGKLKKIIVRFEILPVPKVDQQRYFSDPQYRVEFQRWLNQLWLEKDLQIQQIMQEHNSED